MKKYLFFISLLTIFLGSLNTLVFASSICPKTESESPAAQSILPCRLPIVGSAFYSNALYLSIENEQNSFSFSNLNKTPTTVHVIYLTGCNSQHSYPKSVSNYVSVPGNSTKTFSFTSTCTVENSKAYYPNHSLFSYVNIAVPALEDVNVEIAKG